MRRAVARLALTNARDAKMKAELTTDAYPLSPMQQGMLFHSLSSARGTGVDVEQLFCALHEELNVAAFEWGWQWGVGRDAVLRTSFIWRNSGGPRQMVHPRAELEFCLEDWSGASAGRQKELFSDWLETDRK